MIFVLNLMFNHLKLNEGDALSVEAFVYQTQLRDSNFFYAIDLMRRDLWKKNWKVKWLKEGDVNSIEKMREKERMIRENLNEREEDGRKKEEGSRERGEEERR